MRKLLAALITLICFTKTGAQTLSLNEFLAIVKSEHPVAKKAALAVDIARAEVTTARGGFDPVLSNEIARKELGGLLYYDQQTTEIKIPTWFGVDLVAGIESLTGNRTPTPETKGNSSYLGFSVPLGQGLLMDKRRAALQQARILEKLSLQEQKAVLNDLLYEAAKAYWYWWQQYTEQRLFQQAIQNAAQRFRMVKAAYQVGERPAIDTIEALTQLQVFQLRQNEIALDISNAVLDMTVFLWRNGQPAELPATVVPQPVNNSPSLQLEELLVVTQQHPELQQYRFRLDALQVEKRLKFQSLLPTIQLKYNQLNASHNLAKSFNTALLQNNYRYGVAIALPLRLSEGRGNYKQARLKLEQTRWEQVNKEQSLKTKVQQQLNEWKALQTQIALQQNVITSFRTLQKGEEIKFENGESSLFLINARELKTLEAQQKLIDLQYKEAKALAGTLWAAGLLINGQR